MKTTIREISDPGAMMPWRVETLESVFGITPSEALIEANRRYYEKHLADGTHIAIVAEADGKPAGCGAICLSEELPSPDNPSGRCAYLMNIYVREEFRSHGLGHTIVRALVKKARRLGCDKIFLETTDRARSLYKSIGFDELPGIMKYGKFHDSQS